MDTIEKYRAQLLEQTRRIYRETPISEATEQAYLAVPRHRFIKRFREWGSREWRVVTAENLTEYSATLYRNQPLILFGEDDQNIPSTISQPAFVLRMLDLLQLRPGHKVFELGTGSGWNAAMMGHLVGSDGSVESLEIIPELAESAAHAVESMGISNVHIVAGDGAEGYAESAPYDRAVFTAGSFDLPRHFYRQLQDDGLLLVVIKTEGGGDNLCLLRKVGDHFQSIELIPCGFVQVRGKYQFENLEPALLENKIPGWSALRHQEVSKRPFWWGGKGKDGFVLSTFGVRSFLGISEPQFRSFKTAKADPQAPEYHYFGLWDAENRSLVVAHDDQLVAYGSPLAEERLLRGIHQWVELGMPTAASLDLRIYPIDADLTLHDNQWLVKRRDSQFLWSLRQ